MFTIFRRKPEPPPPERKSRAFSDSLDAFGSEQSVVFGRVDDDEPEPAPPTRERSWTPPPNLTTVIAIVAIVGLVLAGYLLRDWRPFQVEASSASVTIESVPAGVEVFTNGVSQGKTPLTLSVTPGEHAFELLHEGRRKPLRAVARAGAAVVHHVEFDGAAAEPAKVASLRISTEPANLRVSVNGVARGRSPLTIDEIQPGTHRVQVFGASRPLERKVQVAAGESAAVIIAAPAAAGGPAAGWLSVTSPVTMQVADENGLIGTSASSRIMLPAGRHDLRIMNDAIGFSERRTIQIVAGGNASIKVELPNAPLSLNAIPWAEVWVDGKRVGETPIGNHLVRVGPHDIVFRHPELGEQRQTVMVTMKTPARVSVNMRKPGS